MNTEVMLDSALAAWHPWHAWHPCRLRELLPVTSSSLSLLAVLWEFLTHSSILPNPTYIFLVRAINAKLVARQQ